MGKIIIGTVLILWGVGSLLGISFGNFIWAFILIAIGIRIILGKNYSKNWNFKSSNKVINEDSINEVNIFSSMDGKIMSDNFKGGNIVMVFSGGKIDLSNVKTTEKSIDLEMIVLFGGGELVIPKGWKVNSQGTSILGGYDIKLEGENSDVTLNIKGVVIFGGVKILN